MRICLSGFNWIIGSYNKDQRLYVVGGHFGGKGEDMHVKVGMGYKVDFKD